MNNVNGDIMMCYAVKVGDAFVTFGEWRGEYMLEDVPVQEAAWFTNEQVQSVLDYFEREGAVAVEVQRSGSGQFY